MKRLTSLFLALATLTTISCNRTPKSIDPASAQAVKVQLDILQDSVDSRWSEMVASDDGKLRDTRQLLRELSAQPGIDRTQLAQLQYANDRLVRRRYDQQTMAESARIDAYDAAQDSLLRVVYAVALPADREPSAPVKTLTDQIQSADAELVSFRVRYDQAASRFNNYLQVHTAELEQLGGKYIKLKPLPLFTLQN
ncbi:hypothetical protein MUN84_03815 [Hymenobacter sp. 5516J-16]|uniref:LemA family protein n=1 Tax=Hymenobacter sublimis TaxID=2933777 RepID=A0ABY4J718_9BACT|nr:MULTISPECIES: hypothetical protein [Hymenobacter]UOQ77798.1 hypothetical protein MUN84_03815 [Hymenobacter sp. 5516J-16]UPL47778.1 hypothetical protein MWH26_11290 [Hymenobacter sublimis]